MQILIIGGGSGGYTAALEAAKYGAEVTLIANELGGECLHRGCIPTKFFLEKNINSQNFPYLLDQLRQLIISTENGIAYLLKKHHIRLIHGYAVMNKNRDVIVNDNIIPYDVLILASGSQPISPKLPNMESYIVHDQMEFLKTSTDLPKKISILGAGAVGIEIAVILHNLGCTVSVQESESEILSVADREMASWLRCILTDMGISFHLNCRQPIYQNVIFCCGRKPFLPEGTDFLCDTNGCICINQNYQTNTSNIYAIGDCNGIDMEASSAMRQALQVIHSLFNKNSLYIYPSAHCIFTTPSLAWVGTPYSDDISVKVSFDSLPAGKIANDSYGCLKIFYNPRSGIISSIHILSNQASILISTAQIICQTKMTVTQLKCTIFPHPSVSEIFQEAAIKADQKRCRY